MIKWRIWWLLWFFRDKRVGHLSEGGVGHLSEGPFCRKLIQHIGFFHESMFLFFFPFVFVGSIGWVVHDCGSSFSPHFDCGLWKSTKILGWVGVEPHNLFLSNKRGFCDPHISICIDERNLTFLPLSCQMYQLDSMNVMGRNSQKNPTEMVAPCQALRGWNYDLAAISFE